MSPDRSIEFRIGKATKVTIAKEGRITLGQRLRICLRILFARCELS